MKNEDDIRRYTRADFEARRARGESRSDLDRVRAMPEAELERAIAGDPEFRDVPHDWHATAEAAMPVAKRLLSLRLDAEVIDWFKHQGPGYQTRMNAVLRAFMVHAAKAGPGRAGG